MVALYIDLNTDSVLLGNKQLAQPFCRHKYDLCRYNPNLNFLLNNLMLGLTILPCYKSKIEVPL